MKLAAPTLIAMLIASPCQVLAQGAVEAPAEVYLGALLFYRIDRATIVYPAGPGEDAAENRASALTRAAFLEATRGIRSEVVADDAVTAEQRAGHLLLLGWSNRLLGTQEAPRPFTRTQGELQFLGIQEADSSVDLMLFSISPYNREKALLFWSRIDLDRDRMMPLPTVGSDWAIFRDFRILLQGMFVRPHSWPPERSPAAEKDHRPEIADARRNDGRRQTARYDIVFDTSRVPPEEVEAIGRARESALDAAIAAIGSVPDGFRISLSLFEDEEDKKERVGRAGVAHSLPGSREMFMTRRAARSPVPHEEVHHVARQVLGACRLTTLYEGLASAVDGRIGRYDPELLTAAILEHGLFPSLDNLLREESARSLADEIRFPIASLLGRFLLDTVDRDALRRAYTLREGSAAALAAAIGKPEASIENTFREWIEKRLAARADDLSHAKALREAHDRLLGADWAGVAEALERAVRIQPDHLQSLYDLAGAEMRIGEYEKAESRLRRLAAIPLGGKGARFAVLGTYQLGRLFDVQGRRDEALAEYRKVLEMPDVEDSRRLAREAIDVPVTKENLE